MTQSLLSSLLSDFWADLQDPGLLWQIVTLAGCLGAGSLLARLLRSKVSAQEMQLHVMRLGVESFARVISPLLSLSFIVTAKPVLAQWHHVNLLRVAIPLVGSID